MSKIKLNCPVCGNEFERTRGEYNRSIKIGRPQYCSRSCSGKGNLNNLGEHLGNASQIIGKGKVWAPDEFTPFRYHMRIIKRRSYIKGESDITLEYLKELWEQQGGLCPFTGWELLLPKGSSYSGDPDSMYRASIDRLDNSKGYVIGNIRFISVIANYCRNTFTDDQVRLFCESVHKHTGTI